MRLNSEEQGKLNGENCPLVLFRCKPDLSAGSLNMSFYD